MVECPEQYKYVCVFSILFPPESQPSDNHLSTKTLQASMEHAPYNLLTSDNLGSMMIGVSISLVLCGIVIIQAYTYYQRFSDDRSFLKVLVSSFYPWSTMFRFS